MNRIILTFIIPLIFIFNLSGQTASSTAPLQICGSPPLDGFDIEDYLENLKRTDPTAYQEFLKKEQYSAAFNRQFGNQQVFYAHDFNGDKPYTIQATLRKQAGRVRIWVEDDSWDSSFVTLAEVDAIYNALEVSTPSGSIDPGSGIVDIDTMLFGQPPNRNGDGIIDFLILNIKDDFDPDAGSFSFIAGYFNPNDQTNSSSSNQRDLLYLDSYPGISYQGEPRTTTVLSTTAHELQHLIHYHYDTNEENWVNEGLSELAGAYCGYGIGFPYLYLRDTNNNLILFPRNPEVADYAKVSLWTLYIAEQLGLDFIKTLTQHSGNSISSYQTILPAFTSQSFNQIYENWTIANHVNDTTVNKHYGYRHAEARGLRALEAETFHQYWLSASGTLKQYGAKYFKFLGDDTLQVDFTNLPDQAMMLKKAQNTNSVIPIHQQLILPEFSPDDEFILLVSNSFGESPYAFNAYAPFSLQHYEEVAYDDYQTDGAITHPNIWSVANKFVVPSTGVQLNRIKFYNPLFNTSVRIQIFNDNGSGRPGSAISTPVDTTIAYKNNWVNIKLPTPVTGLSGGQSIFVGVEFLDPNKAAGYDQNNVGEGISFVNVGSGWRPLSAVTPSSLEGVLMIRAIFEGGFVESGAPVVQTPLVKLGPNPNVNGTIYLNAELDGPGEIIIQFYNVLGQKVGQFRRNFSTGGPQPPISLNMREGFGRIMPNGIYFSTITFRNFVTGEKTNLGNPKIIFLK